VRVVELFAGAGGMSLGFKRAGYEIVQAYDCWDKAVSVYRSNIGPHAWQADLKDIFRIGPMIAALAPDIIIGGPPCQDFSTAGDRVEGERAEMTRAFAMLVCIARPAWTVMENVPRASNSKSWADARAMLVRAGYGLTECKLNASYYGVPQARKRLIVVGRLGEQHGFLESALVAARSATPMHVREILRSSLSEDSNLLARGAFYTRPFYTGRGVRLLDEAAPSVIRTTREAPRPHYLQSPHPDDPVPASEAGLLTQGQVARIQGFPADWNWSSAGSRDMDQLVANAVPTPLAEVVARVILAREDGQTIPALQGRFGSWLAAAHHFSKPAIRNAKSRVNRARRMLAGRTFADGALEIAALEAAKDFADLPMATRSDLRKSLRLYREWQSQIRKARRGGVQPKVGAEALAA
jgi:DNA (cytosine-5)-methyltransferase 1